MARPYALLDRNNLPVQALAPSAVVPVSVGAVSVRVALPPDTFCVRIAAVNDCYLAFGDSGVTADGTSHLFLRGAEVFKTPTGATHVAFIQHTTGGAASVSVME
jgi:hypothetical protein